MKPTTDIIAKLKEHVDSLAPALLDLSHRIHANPETANEERKASAWCAELLRSEGFEVTMPVAGLETAFRAQCGSGRPVLAFLAEYDALPGVGHACGHNIIAASALGAGMALARVLEEAGLEATVLVDGTPAEETTSGKLVMVSAGLYREVDAVLSMHPETEDAVGGSCLGIARLSFSFKGRAAHAASSPEKGVNALDAAIQTFNNVNALRQHTKSDARIHGIITDGGKAANIVPDFARCEFGVRSVDLGYLKELLEKVRKCARAAALATGAGLDIEETPICEPIKENRTLTRLTLEAMAEVGRRADDRTGKHFSASTDFGNVSQVVPAIAPMVKAAPEETVLHHPDFAAAAASPQGDAAVVAAAKVMAIVGLRLVLEPETLKKAWSDFTGEAPVTADSAGRAAGTAGAPRPEAGAGRF